MQNKLAVARKIMTKASEIVGPLLLGYEISDQLNDINREQNAIVKYIEQPIVQNENSKEFKQYFFYFLLIGLILALAKIALAIYEICKDNKRKYTRRTNQIELEDI